MQLFAFRFRKGLLLNMCFSEYRTVLFGLESQEESEDSHGSLQEEGLLQEGEERISVPSGTLTMRKETSHKYLKM